MATPDKSKLNLSQKEAENMAKIMKDPKFMEMFADYAKEMSDPKQREEMETALKEAENRGEKVPGFPEGKDLLIPSKGFCAKTKNEGTGIKVFINICHSDKVKKASGKERPDKSGTEWDIPYSLGPPTKDTDKGGTECDVHDFVVNSETLKLALESQRYKRFLVETAIDAVERQRCVKLSRDFTLPRMKYKGVGEPKMLTISKGPSTPQPKAPNRKPGEKTRAATEAPKSVPKMATQASSNLADHPCPPKTDPSHVNTEFSVEQPGKETDPAGLDRENSSTSSLSIDVNNNGSPKLTLATKDSLRLPECQGNGSEKPGQEVEPKYKVVYRNNLDLAQFWEDKANLLVGEELKEIILRVHLPGVVDLTDIQLDVNRSEVSVVVPGKYNLKVPLKYRVDDGRGQAKFDKEKPLHQLEVTLPVIKQPPRVQHDKETLMM